MTYIDSSKAREWLTAYEKGTPRVVIATIEELIDLVNDHSHLSVGQKNYIRREIEWLSQHKAYWWRWVYRMRISLLATYINTCEE